MSGPGAPSPASTAARISRGVVRPGFEAVQAHFDRALLSDSHLSAQLCAVWRGEVVVDLWGGPDIAADSLTGVFSSSKGVAALAVALLTQEGEIDLDATVAHYWPEFAAEGKGGLLVRELLSHQAGLVGVAGNRWQDLLDSRELAERLASSVPSWRPASTFGYHALTIGVLVEELVRRIGHESVQRIVEERLRAPSGAEFWLGMPPALDARYRDILPVVAVAADQAEPDGLSALAFSAAMNDDGQLALVPNLPAIRRAGPVAVGGVGTARGLATLYAAAVTGIDGAPALLTPETCQRVGQQQVWGQDRVLHKPMSFSILFMKPLPTMPFGSGLAFGHDGASGSLGFADPAHDLAFGYIPQRMHADVVPSLPIELSAIVRRCIGNLA